MPAFPCPDTPPDPCAGFGTAPLLTTIVFDPDNSALADFELLTQFRLSGGCVGADDDGLDTPEYAPTSAGPWSPLTSPTGDGRFVIDQGVCDTLQLNANGLGTMFVRVLCQKAGCPSIYSTTSVTVDCTNPCSNLAITNIVVTGANGAVSPFAVGDQVSVTATCVGGEDPMALSWQSSQNGSLSFPPTFLNTGQAELVLITQEMCDAIAADPAGDGSSLFFHVTCSKQGCPPVTSQAVINLDCGTDCSTLALNGRGWSGLNGASGPYAPGDQVRFTIDCAGEENTALEWAPAPTGPFTPVGPFDAQGEQIVTISQQMCDAVGTTPGSILYWRFSCLKNGCPPQTDVVGMNLDCELCCGPNILQDPNFAGWGPDPANPGDQLGPDGWASDAPFIGLNQQALETQLSTQAGAQSWFNGAISQVPFPGDPANGIGASDTYLWANGTDQNTGAPWVILKGTFQVEPNTEHKLVFYSSSGLDPVQGTGTLTETTYHVEIDGVNVSGAVTEPAHTNGVDTWIRNEYTFTSAANGLVSIEFFNDEPEFVGNDWMITAVGINPMIPCSEVPLTVNAGPATQDVPVGGTGTITGTAVGGTPPYTHQWEVADDAAGTNAAPINGETSPTLDVNGT